MDWTTIITSALAVIFGGGWLATWRVQRREDKKASNEEWQSLYNETRARNAGLEHKIDELRSENLDLKLENEKLKAQIERNTEDINELRAQVKNLLAKV